MTAKKKQEKVEKNEQKEVKAMKAAPQSGATPPIAAVAKEGAPQEKKAKPIGPRHGIPMPAQGSKFFGSPGAGKRPGPRVPPAHPIHMPTGNRRGG
ncbi:MAG: hypothetical protein ACHQXA_01015 [Gemmatimonadales bacterium]